MLESLPVGLIGKLVTVPIAFALIALTGWYVVVPRLASWVARGQRGRRWQRLVALITAIAALVAVFGIGYVATARIETGVSSLPYLRPVLTMVTSTYFYVVLSLFVLRRLLFMRRGLYARQAASTTGLSLETVKRLAEEVRSPEGATRAIVFSGDGIEEIKERLTTALTTGEDDRLAPRTLEADEPHEEDVIEDATEEQPTLPVLKDDEEPDLRTEFELFRMDLGASINWTRAIWTFAAPAIAVFGTIIIVLGIWAELIVYPIAALAGVSVGLLNYLRVRWSLSRRLDSLRTEEEELSWSKLAVPVQRVETPEVTLYYTWLLGDCYASPDPDELVETVASRAQDKLHGTEPRPSILTKYANQLRHYYPDLEGFRDDQKRRIMLELVDRIEDSSTGVLPREKLIADVVEYDRDSRGVSWEGYDPDLVREAYEDLVPERLAEVDVTVDVDGEEREIRAVTSTIHPIDPTHAQLRAEFSTLFGNFNGEATPYAAPEPSLDSRRLPRIAPVSVEATDLEGVVHG